MAATDVPRTRADIEAIVDKLETATESTSSQALEELLKKLHAATRTLPDTSLHPLFSKRGVRILGRYGFQETPKPEHLPALRCLNNVLVRSTESRKAVPTEIGSERIVATLRRDEPDDEVALANIIIFSCQDTTLNLTAAFDDDNLAEAINKTLARHVERKSWPTAEPTSACSATLRLLSTLAARYENHADHFLDAVDPVLEMLSRATVLSEPLQPPVSILVNCLPVLPLAKKTQMSVTAMDKLVEILENCIGFYDPQDKEYEFLPLLLALNHISSSPAKEAKERLQQRIIPSDEDRKEALGKGQSLPHKLLSMSNMSMFPEVREVIMTMFFNLSDRDPSRFVYNVGFGNAAGYLSSKGIEISQKDMGETVGARNINPITGQMMDSEPQADLPEMTDEEKEREAERLFVLFERLKATGVVDVENPVRQAMESGRIQELDDDASDEDDASRKN